jgi:hypothetical protein
MKQEGKITMGDETRQRRFEHLRHVFAAMEATP